MCPTPRQFSAVLSLAAAICLLSPLLALGSHHRGCGGGTGVGDLSGAVGMATLGGIKEVVGVGHSNNPELEQLARFAVDEHNKKENALLEFARVVKAKEQVVSGTLHHLTLEVIEAGKKKLYEAKVWVRPWLSSKELQEFKHVNEPTDPTITAADLGAKRGDPQEGPHEVAAHDPIVQEAANRAVQFMQERSNSLAPYELLDILDSRAEVANELAKFHLLLKVKRGASEEKFRVEVHKNLDGAFLLNQMQREHSSD